VPWPDLVYALDEGFTAEEFRRVMDAPREALLRKRALIRRQLARPRLARGRQHPRGDRALLPAAGRQRLT